MKEHRRLVAAMLGIDIKDLRPEQSTDGWLRAQRTAVLLKAEKGLWSAAIDLSDASGNGLAKTPRGALLAALHNAKLRIDCGEGGGDEELLEIAKMRARLTEGATFMEVHGG